MGPKRWNVSSPEFRRQGDLGRQVLLTLSVYCVLSAKVESDVRTASTLRLILQGLLRYKLLSRSGDFLTIQSAMGFERSCVRYDVCSPLLTYPLLPPWLKPQCPGPGALGLHDTLIYYLD